MTRESGFWAGMRCLRVRMSQCQSGYVVVFDNGIKHWTVHFANGSVANRGELADFVLAPYKSFALRIWEQQ
jgi:hypothetical protein